MLGQWDKRIVDQEADVPSIISFYTFYRLRALKTLYFYFCNFIKKNKKINWKDFCKEFCKKSWKKNNTWNIRQLVDDSFVPSSKQPSILYCKLTDLKSNDEGDSSSSPKLSAWQHLDESLWALTKILENPHRVPGHFFWLPRDLFASHPLKVC